MSESGNENLVAVRARTGKVARLPVEVRNVVNQAMRDGKRQGEIIAELVAQGFPGMTKSNLTRWRRGGYARWLKEQEAFERLHELSVEGKALLGQLQPGGRSTFADLGEALLATHLGEMLQAFESRDSAQRGEDFLRLTRAFTGFMMARAQRQRVELERLKYESELRRKRPTPGRQGLSDEDEAQIVERVKLL